MFYLIRSIGRIPAGHKRCSITGIFVHIDRLDAVTVGIDIIHGRRSELPFVFHGIPVQILEAVFGYDYLGTGGFIYPDPVKPAVSLLQDIIPAAIVFIIAAVLLRNEKSKQNGTGSLLPAPGPQYCTQRLPHDKITPALIKSGRG